MLRAHHGGGPVALHLHAPLEGGEEHLLLDFQVAAHGQHEGLAVLPRRRGVAGPGRRLRIGVERVAAAVVGLHPGADGGRLVPGALAQGAAPGAVAGVQGRPAELSPALGDEALEQGARIARGDQHQLVVGGQGIEGPRQGGGVLVGGKRAQVEGSRRHGAPCGMKGCRSRKSRLTTAPRGCT